MYDGYFLFWLSIIEAHEYSRTVWQESKLPINYKLLCRPKSFSSSVPRQHEGNSA